MTLWIEAKTITHMAVYGSSMNQNSDSKVIANNNGVLRSSSKIYVRYLSGKSEIYRLPIAS